MSQPEMGRDFEDGVDATREELSDAISIIEEELSKAWITPEAANALRILVNFRNEGDE